MSPVRLALALVVLSLPLAGAAPAGASTGSPTRAAAAKALRACKTGPNRTRCRCPKGKVLVTSGSGSKRRYRCARKPKPPAAAPPATPPTAPPAATAPAAPVPPATAPPATTPPESVRNDQALVDALKSTTFYKTYNGGAGYGSYAYNFLPANPTADPTIFTLRYCTYYVSFVASGSAQRDNYDGAWKVEEGYTFPSNPGLVGGWLVLYRPAMGQEALRAKVAISGDRAELDVYGSQWFEGGAYANRPGQATTNCGAWEPDA